MAVQLPRGFHWERLQREHPRSRFLSGEPDVDEWLRARAWQHQKKHLSTTRVLLDEEDRIAGYFTLATGQVDFGDLPEPVRRQLPRRLLPVAVVAWLGVAQACQGKGLGTRLLAQALLDAYTAGQTFAFIAVIVDCLNESAKSFYERWDFQELPGHPYRLFLSYQQLENMVRDEAR